MWSNSRSIFPKSTLSLLFIQILLWLKNRIASRTTTAAPTNKQVKGKQDKNPLLTSPCPKCKAHPSTALTLTICLKQRWDFWLWQELRKLLCVSVNNHLPKILCLVFGRSQAHSSPYSLAAVRHNSAAPVCHLFYSQSGQNVCKLFVLAVSILTMQWTFLDFVLKVHLGSFILRARNNTIFWIWGNFKERGEQYRTIWDNMEIGATMICLHLKPDWRLSVPRRWTIWGNMKSGATIAPFPFGSLIGQLQNMEQYGAIWKVGQPWFVYIWNQIEGCLCLGILKNKNFILVLL